MRYYQVAVADPAYHKNGPLTYAFESTLPTGTLITVPVKQKSCIGIVLNEVEKPAFNTKSILSIVNEKPLPQTSLHLLSWLKTYYPAPSGSTVALFAPSLLITKERIAPILSVAKPKTEQLPRLTREQTAALKSLSDSMKGSAIVHGDTGTGKTRLYIECALKALENKASSLILTPEISLTSQLAEQFRAVFGERVLVIHSELSQKQRQLLWLTIHQATEPMIIIGARSALFYPYEKLGLVVVDEEHEPAYKQEQAPYYQTTRVAGALAKEHQALLLLGSATPLITDYFFTQQKEGKIIRMSESAKSTETHENSVQIIDIKNREEFTKHPFVSNALLSAVQRALQNNEQILIYLNRRGTARLVLCQNCGWQAHCPRCDLPLTFHADEHTMRCHTCGHKETPPSKCPDCANPDIIFKSIGTKSLVTFFEKEFPSAIIGRYDTDNTRSEKIDRNYEDIKAGKVDILIGTQMLAKGLDLPKLSVVGVVLADSSLYLPDYTSDERTFQLLYQVLGRVGRGHRSSVAVVQTFQPDNPIFKLAINKQWKEFYEQELLVRKQFSLPPYRYTLKLTCYRKSSASAQKTAEQLTKELKNTPSLQLLGPTPCFHEKQGQNYRWQIVVKSSKRSSLLAVIKALPNGWNYDIDPSNLL
jgi:primosomal protein N' (replication factor Y) (superfamily II helicase)